MAFFFGEHRWDLESPDIRGHATPSLSCVWAEGGSSSHNRPSRPPAKSGAEDRQGLLGVLLLCFPASGDQE